MLGLTALVSIDSMPAAHKFLLVPVIFRLTGRRNYRKKERAMTRSTQHWRRLPSLLAVFAILFAGMIGSAAPARAAGSISLTTVGSPYTQNFDTLAITLTSSAVPAGWDFAESGTSANTTYAAGTGSSTT